MLQYGNNSRRRIEMGKRFRGQHMRIMAMLLAAVVFVGSMDVNMLCVQAAQGDDSYKEDYEEAEYNESVSDDEDAGDDEETSVQEESADDNNIEKEAYAADAVKETGEQADAVKETADSLVTGEGEEEQDETESAMNFSVDASAPTPKAAQEITVSGLTAVTKVYDGQKAACSGEIKATVADETSGEQDITEQLEYACTISGMGKNNVAYNETCSLSTGSSSSDILTAINGKMPKDAGNYNVAIAISDNAGAYPAKTVNYPFNITQKPVTITAESKEMIVGGEKPEYTVKIEGMVEGEELQKKEELSCSDNSNTTEVTGSYVISVVGSQELEQANYNYKISYHPGILSVQDKPLATVSGIEIAEKVYDGTPVTSSGTVKVTIKDASGNDQDITGSATIVYAISGTEASGEPFASDNLNDLPTNAGSYKLTVTASGAAFKGTLIKDFNIKQKPIIIKPFDFTISEGAEMPKFTYSYVGDGLVGTDSFLVPPKITCETDKTDKPGTYEITAKDGHIPGNNYTITYQKGTLTILEKDKVTISGITVSDKIYDGKQVECTANPKATVGQGTDVTDEVKFSYKIVDAQTGGADFLSTDLANMPTEAGEYTLTVTVSDDLEKYKGSREFKFEVLKRKIIVKVIDVELRTEDKIPMEFEYEITGDGFLDGDDFEREPRFFCEIENTNSTGTYEITASGADAGSNYIVSYVKGILTVIEKEVEKTKELVRIITPEPVSNVKNATPIGAIALPETVQIVTRKLGAGDDPDEERTERAQVIWERQPIGGTTYQPGVKEQQMFLLGGTVTLPDDVVPGSDQPEVKIQVTVCEEWTSTDAVATPTASIDSGTKVRNGTMVELKCATEDATIYYTLDGSLPMKDDPLADSGLTTKRGNVYSRPIELNEHATVIRAYAVRKGCPDSAYAKFTYFITDGLEDDDPDQPEVPDEDIPEDGKIPEGLWSTKIPDYVYTGKAIKPVVRVYDYKTLLVEKKDYTIAYRNNVNAAGKDAAKAPSIIITGKGNYEGKLTKTFTIAPKKITDSDVILDDVVVLYNKKEQKPVPAVVWNGRKLANKKDYIVQEVSGTDAGSKPVTVTGTGNYTGERKFTFTITEGTLVSKLSIGKIPNQTYTGEEIKPVLTVKNKGTALIEGEDYAVTYVNNKEVGTATAVVRGIGKEYVGTKGVTFKIKEAASLSKAKVDIVFNSAPTYLGAGQEVRPSRVTVTLNVKDENGQTVSRTLSENRDYVLSYKNADKAGTATLTLTGKGAYGGMLKRSYKVGAYDIAGNKITVKLNSAYSYVKGGCKAEPTVAFGGTKLKLGSDYTLSYKQNNEAGAKATVIIKGKGNFAGSKEMLYTVTAQNIGKMKISIADKAYQDKKNIYKTTVRITDVSGKPLAAGKDYDKNMEYTYADNSFKKAGDVVAEDDIIPAGTRINVTISAAGSNYTGEIKGTYRIVKTSVSGAKVTIPTQTYTGKKIELTPEDIKVEIKGQVLKATDYEIVECSNNINKGTAKVIIHGLGDYGGTKTVSFKIKGKGLFDFIGK